MTEKTNHKMPESEGPLLCVEINAPITLEAYNDLYIPAMREIFEKYGEVRALYYYPDPDSCVTWEEKAAALDLQLTADKGHHVKKVALVNPPEKVIVRWMIKQPLLGGEVKIFDQSDLKEAVVWAKS